MDDKKSKRLEAYLLTEEGKNLKPDEVALLTLMENDTHDVGIKFIRWCGYQHWDWDRRHGMPASAKASRVVDR